MGKKDRKKNDYWDNEFENDQELLEETPKEEQEEKPEKKNNKKKKGAKETPAPKEEEPKKEEEVNEESKKEETKTSANQKKNNKKKKGVKETPAPKEEEPKKEKEVNEESKKEETKESKKEETKTSANQKKNNKKKKGAKETPAPKEEEPKKEESKKEKESKKEDPKTKGKKKGGISKSLQQALIKQKEEEEKRKIEEKEREKREEERRIERQKREEEEKRKKEEEKRKKDEEKKRKNEEKKREEEEEKRKEILARLTGSKDVQIPAKQNDKKNLKPKTQSAMYSSRKKKKPNQENKIEDKRQENQQNEISSSQTSNSTPSDLLLSGELLESWEDFANDINEEKPEIKKEPKEEKVKKGETKEDITKEEKVKKEETKEGITEIESTSSKKESNLRSPIICILGHVDTGKTKLLDKIRKTNVQEGEAGGITQQIGATWFPMENLEKLTSQINSKNPLKSEIPGLLVIDTPGHESFSNLRSRGSSLCDIAILVVDIMHGLEPQTIESINLLKKKKTPFVVALNKIDRLFDWKQKFNVSLQETLKSQKKSVQEEYDSRVKETIVAFAEQGLNAQLYYKQKSLKDFRSTVSLVPTSAISGEGIPDILMLLVQLTQRLMAEKLLYLTSLQCTVLEVKVIEGLGTTIDVILVNGTLYEGDRIVVCGLNGPIVTTIRALLTPQPLKEMRIKGTYQHHKKIKAAQGIKIIGKDLDNAVAGSSLFVVNPNDDLEEIKKEVMQDLENMKKKVNKQEIGVYVQASTLGSLEALLEFLQDCKIPVAGINIGPVNKKDVTRASIMLNREHKEYAVILAFDVKLNPQAVETAESLGVEIFRADIIYHLFDQFSQYMENVREKKKNENKAIAVFPVKLQILKCFNAKSPLVLGVKVIEGTLRIGTPLCAHSKNCDIGKVTSIQRENKEIKSGKVGDEIAIKVELPEGEQQKAFDRHFDINDELVSKISRQSLDALKESFRDELTKEDVALLVKLKSIFKFQ